MSRFLEVKEGIGKLKIGFMVADTHYNPSYSKYTVTAQISNVIGPHRIGQQRWPEYSESWLESPILRPSMKIFFFF